MRTIEQNIANARSDFEDSVTEIDFYERDRNAQSDRANNRISIGAPSAGPITSRRHNQVMRQSASLGSCFTPEPQEVVAYLAARQPEIAVIEVDQNEYVTGIP